MYLSLKKSIPHLLYFVLLVSMIFSFRAVSSITVGLLLLTGIFIHRSAKKSVFSDKNRNIFLAGCTLYFLIQLVALLYTDNMEEGWANVRIKSAVVLVPLALYMVQPDTTQRAKIMQQFCIVLFAAALYCLINALLLFRTTGESSVFFYHKLASHINQHAVYLSVLTITGIVFLLETLIKNKRFANSIVPILLAIWLSGFLVLLSSKFVLAFYFLYLVSFFFRLFNRSEVKRVVIAAIITICLASLIVVIKTRNPVRERFADIINSDLSLIKRDSFNQGVYFNGLQFRLLQWRLVGEILTTKKAWWTGIGAGDAEAILNQKFIELNMYTGDPERSDRGYLIYNTHNQFLETILQTGIIGLFPVLLICFALTRIILRSKDVQVIFSTCLILAWLMIEAVFETQYGIMIFSILSIFIAAGIGLPDRVEKTSMKSSSRKSTTVLF